MQKYRNLHLWMILPFVLVMLGFIRSYFSTWTDEFWRHHLHGISAMLWYVVIIVQPYLATRGKLPQHRTLGIIGAFLAGAVAFSAMVILPDDIAIAIFLDGGNFGPGQLGYDFFFGIVLTELVSMLAFVFAVIMAIIKRKELENHVTWLISTVFLVLMPGLGRGLGELFANHWNNTYQNGIFVSLGIIMAGILVVAYRTKKLTHPAYIIALLVNALFFFTWEIGANVAYQEWIIGFMKY